MTDLEIIKWIAVGLMSLGVWFMKRTLDRVEDDVDTCKKDIQKIREDYLHKNEFKEFKSELKDMFEVIRADIRAINKH
jgi:hypothetical protein